LRVVAALIPVLIGIVEPPAEGSLFFTLTAEKADVGRVEIRRHWSTKPPNHTWAFS
jgi:hypothetical protein